MSHREKLYILCGVEIYVALASESTDRRAVCVESDHMSNAAALVKSQLGRELFLLDRFFPHQSLPGRLGGWEDWRMAAMLENIRVSLPSAEKNTMT